jgi:hypothetical protein
MENIKTRIGLPYLKSDLLKGEKHEIDQAFN